MSKITDSAKGQKCLVRIPGKCNCNPNTVVLAHRNGGGMGRKNPDYQGAFSCSACHDVLDGRDYKHSFTPEDIYLMFCDGVWRTQETLREEGLIVVDER